MPSKPPKGKGGAAKPPKAAGKDEAAGAAAVGAKAAANSLGPAKAGVSKVNSKAKKQPALSGMVKADTPTEAPPASVDIQEIMKKRAETIAAIQTVEKQIYNLETDYFKKVNPQGNALKGYEGLLSSAAATAKKARFRDDVDRVFSGSSITGQLPHATGQAAR